MSAVDVARIVASSGARLLLPSELPGLLRLRLRVAVADVIRLAAGFSDKFHCRPARDYPALFIVEDGLEHLPARFIGLALDGVDGVVFRLKARKEFEGKGPEYEEIA